MFKGIKFLISTKTMVVKKGSQMRFLAWVLEVKEMAI
jgi:hypothetical protein